MAQLLTLAEISARTHRSVTALRKQMSRGRFPFSKVSGRLCCDEGELTRFLALSRRISAEQAVQKVGEA